MNVKSISSVLGLLVVLFVLAGVLWSSMYWLANRDVTVEVASPTPALTSALDLAAVKGPKPVVEPTEVVAEVSPTVKPTSTPVPYNSNTAMYLVFAGFELSPGFGPLNDRTLDVLARIRSEMDRSQVRPLIESFRYLLSTDIIEGAVETLEVLTGQTTIGDDWKAWSEWIGRNGEDYPVPSEYELWKINYLRQIDGRFGAFLTPALNGRSAIDLTELEWGGVVPDGIPPLENPGHAPADDPLADYLEDDERVIGVSINGEHRAYPLRIVNAHELVNDVLGGEPLSLTW